MKCVSQRKLSFIVAVLLTALSLPAFAEMDVTGDWLLKSDFEGREFESILSLSKNKEGKLAGQWIGFMGVNDAQDLKVTDTQVSFKIVNRFGDNEMTTNFTGTIKDGVLSATMSSDRGDYNMKGKKMPPVPDIVGTWEFKTTRREREMITTIIIKQDKEGKMAVDWKTQRGESAISDVNYTDNKLTFKRTSTFNDQQRTSEYQFTASGNAITGVQKTERGDREMSGTRIGGELIGKWDLTLASDRGDRKQILWIYPDMSARYGAERLETISIENNAIQFKMVRSFGDRTFQSEFKGKLEDGKLTGEIASDWGSQTITGKKVK